MTSVPTDIDGFRKLKIATSGVRNRLTAVWQALARLSAEMTSTGTVESATVRSVRRVPVTTIVPLSTSAAACGAASAGASATCANAVDENAIELTESRRRLGMAVITDPPTSGPAA